MLKEIKKIAMRNIANIPGWRTDRKIVVIESDDWGAIRMPSKEVYQRLLSEGISVSTSIYDQLDTLENREDLNALFDVIASYTDFTGKHPVMTFNTVMGNPDFERIKDDSYENYYFQHFYDTYKEYYQDDLSLLWYSAMQNGLIRPQFHGREHVNVLLWMKALQKDFNKVRLSFDNSCYISKSTPSNKQKNYLASYWVESPEDLRNVKNIVKDGLDIFKETFGYYSESFVANNYVFPVELESILSDYGVKFIQGQRGHVSPHANNGKIRIRRNFTGQTNKDRQFFLVRNCFLEPSSNPDKDWVISCLQDVKTAFRWKKPAIISSHRVNYISGLSLENRKDGLKTLNRLLERILERWPNVEFMSSDELGKTIRSNS